MCSCSEYAPNHKCVYMVHVVGKEPQAFLNVVSAIEHARSSVTVANPVTIKVIKLSQ